MHAEEIKDRESLHIWLRDCARDNAALMALRSAMRVLPLALAARQELIKKFSDLTLYRVLLTTGAWIACPPDRERIAEVIERLDHINPAALVGRGLGSSQVLMAFDAAALVMTTTRSSDWPLLASRAVDTARKAVKAYEERNLSHHSSTSAGVTIYKTETSELVTDDFWKPVREDCAQIAQGPGVLHDLPLWLDHPPMWLPWAEFEGENVRELLPTIWSFWHRWWEGASIGQPIDWNVQRDIALIPDAEWQQGPDHIARLIARIELDHAIVATPNAEGIERDANGLFFAVPVIASPANPFRNAKDKVGDTVAEIRARLSHNAISAILDDLARLEDHLARYADNPLRIHDVFEKTMRHIRSKLATTELSREDLVDDLLQDLDSGAIDIRRADKEVARTVKARGSERLKRLKAAERTRYDSAMVDASAEARDDLKAEIAADLAVVAAPARTDAAEADRDESSYRLLSRGARMAKRRKDDLVKSADDLGKIDKGVQAVSKVAEAAPGWWDVIASTVGGMFG